MIVEVSTSQELSGKAKTEPPLAHDTRAAVEDVDLVRLMRIAYQMFTRLSGGRIIGELSGRLNAFANSERFESGPMTR